MKLRCTKCGHEGPAETFRETEVGCDDCGTHPARECPACEELLDEVFNEVEEVEEVE